MSILVVAEHRQGRVRGVTAELVTAASTLGQTIVLVVVAPDCGALDLSFAGVDEVVHVAVDAPEFDSDVYLNAVAQLIAERRPRATLLPFSVNSMSYAAGLAVRTSAGFASDVHALAIDGDHIVATRSFYGGKVEGEIELADGAILVLRAGVWPAAAPGNPAAVTEVALGGTRSRTRHVEFVEPASNDVDITAADFVLAIGRGIGGLENLELFEELASKLHAVLAVSRPLVDAGWVTNARQVGQSGKTVKPKVYLALGISGAVQHIAGMRESGTIIAVNSDPEAAIFTLADYGAVADLFDIAEELGQLS
jgi:electron transfer flavoprotein alpha subunit